MFPIPQALSTWYLASRQPDFRELSTILAQTGRRDREARHDLELRPGGEQPSAGVPIVLDAEPIDGPPSSTAGVPQVDPDAAWANTASQAVQRLDTAMKNRLEALALERGLVPDDILPDPQLRERAIASGDLRSDDALALIAAYTRILDELGTGDPQASDAPTP